MDAKPSRPDLFPVKVTDHLQRLIERPDDPLGRQFLPAPQEAETAADDLADPIGDDAFSPLPGLVHRHADRVLLKPVMSCPIHCRFCFRRMHVGTAGTLPADQMAAALDYIRARPTIREVILTGGEPLMLSAKRLNDLMRSLSEIAHLDSVRIHTRMPIAQPAAITDGLVQALAAPLGVWLVVHVNHPRELAPETLAALARLRAAGIPLLSQTVLLRGVNDRAEVLAELMQALIRNRIKPYYLHHPDLVPGTAHFRLSPDQGRAVVEALRRRVSGTAMPLYVLDIPGGFGKVAAAMGRLTKNQGQWQVRDDSGEAHAYPPGRIASDEPT